MGTTALRRASASALIAFTLVMGGLAQAKPSYDEQKAAKALKEVAEEELARKNPYPAAHLQISTVFSDQIIDEVSSDEWEPVQFRDEVVEQIMDTLVRKIGRYPLVIGDVGVGKTAVTRELVYRIVKHLYPLTEAFDKALDEAVVLKVSARRFIPGGADLSGYLNAMRLFRERLGRPLIVVMTESHFLSDYTISVLREELERKDATPVVLETDSKSYGNSIKSYPGFTSLAQPIMVRELSKKQIEEIVEERTVNDILERLKVEIDPSLVSALVDVAPDYRRDISEPRRSLTLIEDFAIAEHRAHFGDSAHIVKPSKEELLAFVAKKIGLPVLPQDEETFVKYMNGVRTRAKARLIGQDHMVDGVIDQFIAALTGRNRQHSVALMLGPTGVGKSLLPEILAEEFYGDKSRYLELDMTQFAEKTSMTTLFGANNGYISSDKEKGVLCDFFDGRAQGGGILVLNEIEEANSEVFTRFMEIFDKGVFPGGDGRMRYLGRTLVVLTSNKNSDKLLAYDAIKGMSKAELQRRLSLITQDQLKKAFTERASYTEDQSKIVKSAVLERVDKLYFASPLLTEDAIKVTQIELNKFKADYERQGFGELEFDPSVAEVLTKAFYNESLGARQIRTAVQQSMTRVIQSLKAEAGYKLGTIRISANLHPSKKTESYITATAVAGQTLTIPGPTVPVANKLLDSAFRERLMNLEKNLESEIFGQPEAISAVVSAVKARFIRGGHGEAVAGFLAGMTGSGKSQLAKSLTKYLFERPEAYHLFDMGRVHNESDMWNIFSPPKGIIGSDQPGELEKFLTQYPDGGVLLFDEMSNAGGANRALKEAIAKQFYTIFQEGYYVSPAGKKFDLSNHVIILTGNDGEEYFKGMNSDSMLEETYKEVTKNPQHMNDILHKAGFSDAFIGRLSFAVLMRPTVGDVKVMIARKLLNEWRQEVQKNQPIDITYNEDFVKEVGELMFSPRTGARSINTFIAKVLGKAIGDEALTLDWDHLIEHGARATIDLSLAVTKPTVPFYSGNEPDKKSAEVLVKTSQNGRVISEDRVEFTRYANFMPQLHIDSARATAYHEMGHAVAAFTETTGMKVIKITIVPEMLAGGLSAAGYQQSRRVPVKTEPNYQYLVKRLAHLLAGSEAEAKIGRETTIGRSNDIERAGQMARKMILEYHLMPELDVAHAYADKDGNILGNLPPEKRKLFDDFAHKAIEDGRALAQKTLQEKWNIVEAGVKILMKKGVIDEAEFDRLWNPSGSCEQLLVRN